MRQTLPSIKCAACLKIPDDGHSANDAHIYFKYADGTFAGASGHICFLTGCYEST